MSRPFSVYRYRLRQHMKLIDRILVHFFAPSIRRIVVTIVGDYHGNKPMTSHMMHDLIGWAEDFLKCHR
jgi:hypothetical protein